MARNVLIIDDEASIRSSLSGALKDESYEVMTAGSGEEGLGYVANGSYDAVLLDVWMPGIDGIETLKRIRAVSPDQLVIVMSGHGTVETAVKATKLGAYDFIEKPLSLDKLLITLRNAFQFNELNKENRILRSEVSKAPPMIGSSTKLLALKEQIDTIAPLASWVLITGENGTGKELVARAVHAGSKRKDLPFVAVNCAAIPEELIESELFGHEKGSFTGATNMKRGKFDQAHGGTLFLDEIADMSLKTQAKVLRVLQEQVMERVGGTQRIKVDVRVLAATNKDLPGEIRAGRFREDLYFRLKVIPIFVPALRDRQQDIPLLAEHFMAVLAAEYGRRPKRLAPEAAARLQQYGWPGNVRELRNVIERVIIMVGDDTITAQDLAFLGRDGADGAGVPAPGPGPLRPLSEARDDFEKDYILQTLAAQGGNMSRTAEVLGVERSNLYKKLRAFGITPRGGT